jgi:hypothetical protein
MIRLPYLLLSIVLIALALVCARAADAGNSKATDPNPTLVTIYVQNQPLTDVLSQVSKQTGMEVSSAIGAMPTTVTLDEDARPFWNVLDDLCKQTKSSVFPRFNGNNSTMLTLQQGPQFQGQQQIISGPILMRLQQILHSNDLTAAPDRQDLCEITGTAIWEPRLKVIYSEAVTAPTVAEDENGVSLVPDQSAMQAGAPGYPQGQSPFGQFTVPQRFNNVTQYQTDLRIRLHVPSNAGRRVKTLSGKWKVFVTGKTDHLDISPIPSNNGRQQTSYTFGDLGSMRLNYSQSQDQEVQMQFMMTGSASAARACLLQSMHARVVDADNQLWGDTEGDQNGGGQVNANWGGGDQTYIQVYVRRSPSAKGKPAKITLEGPVSATEIDVPFNLNDFPLP